MDVKFYCLVNQGVSSIDLNGSNKFWILPTILLWTQYRRTKNKQDWLFQHLNNLHFASGNVREGIPVKAVVNFNLHSMDPKLKGPLTWVFGKCHHQTVGKRLSSFVVSVKACVEEIGVTTSDLASPFFDNWYTNAKKQTQTSCFLSHFVKFPSVTYLGMCKVSSEGSDDKVIFWEEGGWSTNIQERLFRAFMEI